MSTDMTLRRHWGITTQESYGDFGLEVEIEFDKDELEAVNRGLPIGWTVKRDSSLRNFGLEFATQGPCRKADTKDTSIDSLTAMLDKLSVIKGSPRTSFHVHVNVLDKTPLQVCTSLVAYWLIEELLFNMCGQYRRGNLHCLSLKEAPAVVSELLKDVQRTRYFTSFTQDDYKYAGVNLATIRRFGTLEFRGMGGYTDKSIFKLWSDILYDIVNTPPTNFKDPKEVLDYTYTMLVDKKSSIGDYLNGIFSSKAHAAHVAGLHKEPVTEILASAKRLVPLVYGIHDWHIANKQEVENKARHKSTVEEQLLREFRPVRRTQGMADAIRDAEALDGPAFQRPRAHPMDENGAIE